MSYGAFNVIFDVGASILFIVLIIIFVRMKNKTHINYMFIINALIMLTWIVARFLEEFLNNYYGNINYAFLIIFNICIILIPYSWLLTSYSFIYNKIVINYKSILLLIPPVLSIIVLLTNQYHQWYYVKYTSFQNQNIYGWYYLYPHCIYSYLYMTIGMINIIYFSLRYQGFFSKQNILLFMGALIPTITDVSTTFFNVPTFIGSAGFSFGAILVMFAIIKFKFLKINPIALKSIVDNMSDGFVVIDQKFDIIELNKPFMETFNLDLQNDTNFRDILNLLIDENNRKSYIELIYKVNTSKQKIIFEDNFKNSYYNVEIIPIYLHERNLATAIIFKDITEHKKVLELIKEKETHIIESARLESLGNLIGSIAHNLKTPLMSSSGAISLIDKYLNDMYEVLCEHELQNNIISDYFEKIKKMEAHVKDYLTYINDVISTVKGQLDVSGKDDDIFNISELINRINILMKNELKKNSCTIKYKITNCDKNIELQGSMNYMLQVMNILISNAIDAYLGEKGTIELIVLELNDKIIIKVKDYAKGIPDDIKDKIFSQMITTKGKDGSGLGLYISKSIIKTKFNGDINFTSDITGSEFIITIPRGNRSGIKNKDIDS